MGKDSAPTVPSSNNGKFALPADVVIDKKAGRYSRKGIENGNAVVVKTPDYERTLLVDDPTLKKIDPRVQAARQKIGDGRKDYDEKVKMKATRNEVAQARAAAAFNIARVIEDRTPINRLQPEQEQKAITDYLSARHSVLYNAASPELRNVFDKVWGELLRHKAITLHLAQVNPLLEPASNIIMDLCAAHQFDGRIQPVGGSVDNVVEAHVNYQVARACRNELEKLLLDQMAVLGKEAVASANLAEKKRTILGLLKAFEFYPDLYHTIIESNKDTLTLADQQVAELVLTKRYEGFTSKLLGARPGQSLLEADRAYRRKSEERTLPGSAELRTGYLLRNFRANHDIPNNSKFSSDELKTIKDKIEVDCQMSRLRQYRKCDTWHTHEIDAAEAEYKSTFASSADKKWEALRDKRGWK